MGFQAFSQAAEIQELREQVTAVDQEAMRAIVGGLVRPSAAAVVTEIAGPSSYQVGGFVVDVSAHLAEIWSAAITRTVHPFGGGALLVQRIVPNDPDPGKLRVLLALVHYEQVTHLTDPTNLPAGVTLAVGGVQNVGAINNVGNAASVDAIGGSGTAIRAHQHGAPFLYAHRHGINSALTIAQRLEVLPTSDLSGATFSLIIVGRR